MNTTVNKDFVKILEKYDSETDWEFPKDIDWEELKKKSLTFVEDLKNQLSSYEVSIDDQIQDASFHLSIFIRPNDESPQRVELRLSNFGNLITIFDKKLLNQEDVNEVDRLILSHGFQYIPVEELIKPYSGKLKAFEGDWLTRFFDYM